MNWSRNMGGDLGIVFVTTLVARRAQVHQATLATHTTAYSAPYQAKLEAMASALQHSGASSIGAARQATAVMYRQLIQQSTQLAYLDALSVLAAARR